MTQRTPTISSKRLKDLDRLQASLKVSFGRMSFLEEALTHPSYSAELGGKNYERLEFFGDAVLKFVISEYLIERFHDYDEGTLTEIRAVLVSDKILAKLAQSFNLDRYILLGRQVQMRPSIMSQSMEAVFGAVYADLGLFAAQDLIVRLFGDQTTAVDRDELKDNFKAKLQEVVQGRGESLPIYTIASVEGPAHNPIFEVNVQLVTDPEGKFTGNGKGNTKKYAEQEAAKSCLEKLGILGNRDPAKTIGR